MYGLTPPIRLTDYIFQNANCSTKYGKISKQEPDLTATEGFRLAKSVSSSHSCAVTLRFAMKKHHKIIED
ncbi:MAG: hypothetical protein IKL02_04615 [Kiritimatiellae bacterium]|nr:hypothetical protein [Kiritimatiellia bacterium]